METKILSFMHKLMQPSLKEKVERYVKLRSTSGPIIVEFDPSTLCNFRCPECINRNILNKNEIPLERVYSLIDEFKKADVKGIIFIGGGEPLMHKGMPAPLIYSHDLGMKVGLTTNGSLIEKYVNEIANYVTWTRVSVDAASSDTFSLFRPSGSNHSFKDIIKNIELLSRSKKGLLGYSFLIIDQSNSSEIITNINELYKAARLAKEIGCDYFEYKPMVNNNHHLIPFSKTIKNILVEQIDKMKELNTSEFQVVPSNSISHLLTETNADQPKDYNLCPILEMRTVVTPNGIYPCPYKRGNNDYKLGDIEDAFDEFWISEKRYKFNNKIDPSNECRFYCIRHEMNIGLLALSQAYDKGVDLLQYMHGIELDDVFI